MASATATDQLYYRRKEAGFHISDDLRKLHTVSSTLDENAIYSLLQFGAMIPPLSPWKQIRRVIPGHKTIFSSGGVHSAVESLARREDRAGPAGVFVEDQISSVTATLDRVLTRATNGQRVVILFSGGVDSGLLAARAAALGLDVDLVNYSFGDDDPESRLAEKIARSLGLRFTRVKGSGSELGDILEHAGQYYSAPFCDPSTVPTFALVRAVLSLFSNKAVVLDGTGADGAFGLLRKGKEWRRLHAIPYVLQQAGSVAYKWSQTWASKCTTERRLRVLRRAAQLRYPLAAFAQNPLEGIAYHASEANKKDVQTLALNWLDSLCSADSPVQMAALDLALVCSSIFAQKTKSLFAGSQLEVVYPFLEPEVVDLALDLGSRSDTPTDPKWVLKAALARQVPTECVYRPKSGFTGRTERDFQHPAFLECFDSVTSPNSILSDFIDRGFCKAIRPKLATGTPLPSQTSNFIWGAVFVNQWLESVTRNEPCQLRSFSERCRSTTAGASLSD
jgi:asparagine synthetase B (glutamine-hydrolysing)